MVRDCGQKARGLTLDGKSHLVFAPPVRDIQARVEDQLRAATRAALGEAYADVDPLVRGANARHGDYQANLALSLAKTARRAPREIAEAIVRELLERRGESESIVEAAEVAGPGFINLRLTEAGLLAAASEMFDSERLAVPLPEAPERVVVDYGGANLAKEMHIGHLRSSIIGDAIVRVLEFAGHEVIRQNHIGDWGTAFGMLVENLIDSGWDTEGDHTLADLNALYQSAKTRFDEDADFKERARTRVVKLQGGDPQSLKFWRRLIDESCAHMNDVFERLGIRLNEADLRGESFYNSRLPSVVDDLREAGLLVDSDGARVVFCDGFKTKAGEPLPLIVQKRDGGYGYATTDLAAARFRAQELRAQRIIYVVDARQSDHFAMVFWAVRKAAWVPEDVRLEHVAFGTILGKDKRPFKTRSGDPVKLASVIDDGVARARETLVSKGRELQSDELDTIARAVGVGAIKYADLSSDRIKDYVFDYDRMLSMEGNTAPYLQYAYVRLRSILRKAGTDTCAADLRVTAPEERRLYLELLRLPRVVNQVASSLEPHQLCGYLYELAALVHQFHEHCPVLKAPDESTRRSRLSLTELSGRTLQLGLRLLGVTVVERM